MEVRIKGFDSNLCCRGMQFEIGKEYKINVPDDKLKLYTNSVYHYCKSLQQVHDYYSCKNDKNNRYCFIKVLGKEVCDDAECGSNHIKILREITDEELLIMKGLINGNNGLFNSGNRNSGNLNSGNRNTGYGNSGDRNSGNRNTGYGNSGYGNSGDFNTGNLNSGNLNSGNLNSGNRNSGNLNSGIFNKTNSSNGVFCNIQPKICIFNTQTDWTLSDFYNSKYYSAICSSDFILTKWEKIENSNSVIDGELIVNSYETAYKIWWENMTDENKNIIKSIPNFNVDVFCDITGIDKNKVI